MTERATRLEQADPAVFAAIRRETERQECNLELIASENVVSEAVGDDAALARLGDEVRDLCARFPIYRHHLG